MALQIHHWHCQFLQGWWLFSKSEPSEHSLFPHVLAASASMPHRCSSSVWVSMVLCNNQSLRMDISIYPFTEHVRDHYAKDVTDLPMLETIHIAHILEQIARGYLTGGSSNRWKTHIGNSQQPSQKNILTYFYRFEFQQRGTLHLHMLVWVDISATRADVLHASVPWNNADGAFLVASTQKSDKSCLPLNHHLDSFTTDTLGNTISSYKRRRRQGHTGLHNHSPGVPAVPH